MATKKQMNASSEERCCCGKHATCERPAKTKTARKKATKKVARKVMKKCATKKATKKVGKKVTKKTVARKKASKDKTSEERMKKSVSRKASPIVLEEKLGIKNVAGLSTMLETLLSSDSDLAIDATAVRSVDIAALQVLVGFANLARTQSRDVEWQCGDSVLRQYALVADLDRHLSFDATKPELAEDDGLCPVF